MSEPVPTYMHQWEIEMFDYTAPHLISHSASESSPGRAPPYPYNHPNFPYPNLHLHQPPQSARRRNGFSPGSPPSSPPPPPPPPKRGVANVTGYDVPLRKQNVRAQPLTPEERARMRHTALRQREAEEERAAQEERLLRARRRQERAAEERALIAAEEHRKATLSDELRYAAERKVREEREAREREEERIAEIREHKRAEQERRRKYAIELERWRREQVERSECQAQEKEELRRRSEEAKRERIMRKNEETVKASGKGGMCGWVTMQTPESLAWKRRYFKFDMDKGNVAFYRTPQEMAKPMDTAALDGRVDRVCEWWEGFEELEAIPHSFAIKFIDGQDWLMYADTSDEKDKLLMLVSESAGIII